MRSSAISDFGLLLLHAKPGIPATGKPKSTHVVLILSLLAACLSMGCDIPAQMVWSPNGGQAAYRVAGSAYLLNEQGTVLRTLGGSSGGFAWSADSKALYYAVVEEEPNNPPTPQLRQWLQPIEQAATQPVTKPSTQPTTAAAAVETVLEEDSGITAINVLREGNVQTLCRLARSTVWHMQLSPDEQWLAVMSSINKKETDGDSGAQEYRLFVYSIPTGRLHWVSRYCGIGACFTGPNQLAFVEPNGLDPVGQLAGHLVEVKLDDNAAKLDRRALLDVMVPMTRWLEPCDGGVMFTANPCAFPAKPPVKEVEKVYKLFHFSRGDGGLTVLADDVGELFDRSPDGKRILFEKVTPAALAPATAPTTVPVVVSPKRDELCIMNANGSDPHVLRSLDAYAGSPRPPMWPAWRGNDQITFITPAEDAKIIRVDDKDQKVHDVVLYHLADKGVLEPLITLSGDWAPELKPFTHPEEKPGQ